MTDLTHTESLYDYAARRLEVVKVAKSALQGQLNLLIQEEMDLNRLVRQTSGPAAETVATIEGPATLKQQIAALLSLEAHSSKELLHLIESRYRRTTSLKTVSSLLSKMAQEGLIHPQGSGRWGRSEPAGSGMLTTIEMHAGLGGSSHR